MKGFLILILVPAILLPVNGRGQSAEPPLAPDAQLAFDRGLAAAEQKDWDLAVRYFTGIIRQRVCAIKS